MQKNTASMQKIFEARQKLTFWRVDKKDSDIQETKDLIIFCISWQSRPQNYSSKWPNYYCTSEAGSAWICKKIIKSFVFWLSGPHGTSIFDHQSLIYSDMNYTNIDYRYQVNCFQFKTVMFITERTSFYSLSSHSIFKVNSPWHGFI